MGWVRNTLHGGVATLSLVALPRLAWPLELKPKLPCDTGMLDSDDGRRDDDAERCDDDVHSDEVDREDHKTPHMDASHQTSG